jgi:hypothetical protein
MRQGVVGNVPDVHVWIFQWEVPVEDAIVKVIGGRWV